MRTIPGWDQYYLEICKVVSCRSKDPNTQIGCVIVGPNHEIRSTGYNSFPRGIRDDVPERLARPAKYLWIEHAERNAICNAARAGTATEGWHPSVAVPARAALQMALRSACSIQRYLAGRASRSGTSSRIPRGNELYPVDRISWFGPTITHPICVLGSLLRQETTLQISR